MPFQSSTFNYRVKIDNIKTRKGWNFPSCGGDKCKKGIARKERCFWCEACNKNVKYLVLSFTCWKLAIAEVVEESVGSSNVDAHADVKTKKLKRLATHPSVATPSKPTKDLKKKRLEDSDEEVTCALRYGPKDAKESSPSNKRKKRDSLNNDTRIPSLSNILNNSISIQSNSIIDGNVQSYCGPRLTNIPTPTLGRLPLPNNTNVGEKQKATTSTSNYPLNRSKVRTLGIKFINQGRKIEPPRIRVVTKIPKRASLTSA
ncbi:hypothetical protein Tco_1187151, partial [Tanacetum coccineum]